MNTQKMPVVNWAVVLLCLCIIQSSAWANAQSLTQNPKIVSFIDTMVKKHSFDRKELVGIFSRVEVLPEIIEKITRPAEAMPWHRYRKIFMQEERIAQGREFWQKNEQVLREAEKKYGVPPEIIIAIIGVETRYGRHTGGFRVLDSLTTLAVDYPRRSKFFTKEMEEFLLLTRGEGFDPLSVEGSYAGAIGKPQFMASSYRRYAVDFDGDGVRDLLNNSSDAIGSVANYLNRHGWKRGQPVVTKAAIKGKVGKRLLKKGFKPQTTLAEFKRQGITSRERLNQDTKSALFRLEAEKEMEYWLGLDNFYAITRYNHSALYAMAVYQLAQAIAESRQNIAAK
ncbi:MAG: lytic murein transglycosylase B [Gammaproteobacteria bacterium]|nr:lytic murein transglycosylase B [Gammaproteobacteria bacterium]